MNYYDNKVYINFIKNIPLVLCSLVFAFFANDIVLGILVVLAGIFVAVFSKDYMLGFLRKFNLTFFLISSLVSVLFSNRIYEKSKNIFTENQALTFLFFVVAFLSCFIFIWCFIGYINKTEDSEELPFLNKIYESKWFYNVLAISVAVAVLCSFISCFSADIWLDEAFSLKLVKHSWKDVIVISSTDVHPPLYYLILKLFLVPFTLFSNDFTVITIGAKLCSLLPFLLACILCLKKLDVNKTTKLLVMLTIFGMPQTVYFAMEIRMYSWGLLFITGTFLYALDIINGKNNFKTWFLFIVFSIFSAYTHNFTLISMAVIWLYLFIWFIINSKKDIKKWFLGVLCVAVVYMPWFIILLRQLGEVNGDYWIEPLSWRIFLDYFLYIFSGGAILIPAVIYSRKNSNKNNFIKNNLGILIAVTTITLAVIVSVVMRPIFVSRYMAPCLPALWISLIVLSAKRKPFVKTLVSFVVIVVSLVSVIGCVVMEMQKIPTETKNLQIIENIEKEQNSVIVTSQKYHLSGEVGGYTDVPVYFWNASPNDVMIKTYLNWSGIFGIDEINSLLEKGKVVYYFECVNNHPDSKIPIFEQSEWDIEYIDDCTFDEYNLVYKITKK